MFLMNFISWWALSSGGLSARQDTGLGRFPGSAPSIQDTGPAWHVVLIFSVLLLKAAASSPLGTRVLLGWGAAFHVQASVSPGSSCAGRRSPSLGLPPGAPRALLRHSQWPGGPRPCTGMWPLGLLRSVPTSLHGLPPGSPRWPWQGTTGCARCPLPSPPPTCSPSRQSPPHSPCACPGPRVHTELATALSHPELPPALPGRPASCPLPSGRRLAAGWL